MRHPVSTTTKRPARPDQECLKAWDQIMAIARDHALIVSAYGGVATLAIPDLSNGSSGFGKRCSEPTTLKKRRSMLSDLSGDAPIAKDGA